MSSPLVPVKSNPTIDELLITQTGAIGELKRLNGVCTVGIVWIEVDKRHRIVAGPDMQHQTTATHPECHRVLGHPEAQRVSFAGGCYILNRIVPISLIEGIRIITGSSTEEIAAGSTDKRIV